MVKFSARLSRLRCGRWFVAAFLLCLISLPALAERRAAFVVGNSTYSDAAALESPQNDAALMASTLSQLGFDVDLQLDLTRTDFSRSFSSFLRAHDGADVMLFYYAGHGIQFEDRNYLLATDAELVSEFDIAGETIALDTVVEALERRSKAALVFVDACRDNPIADTFYAENFPGTRSLASRGLAEMRSAYEGTMVVFAASPGQVAYDGDGPNSPFTLALARHLPAENVEVLSLMKRVIRDTRLLTRGRQSPVVTNDLAADVFLRKAAMTALPGREERAAAEWDDFRESRSADALQSFAERHEGTAYAALALERLELLPVPEPETPAYSPRSSVAAPRPQWCAELGDNPTLATICADAELLAFERRVSALFRQRLEAAKGGVAFEALLLSQSDWETARDTCGTDADCIAASHLVRLAALSGAKADFTPAEQVIYAIQTELNRLSCGSGTPDGRAGRQTRTALALARELLPENTLLPASRFRTSDQISLIEMLGDLRNLPDGVCSALFRSSEEPALLVGLWSMIAACDNRSSLGAGSFAYSMRLEHRNGAQFDAVIDNTDGWRETYSGELENGLLSLTQIDRNDGSPRPRVYRFAPGAEPFEMTGRSPFGCDLVATKR